MSPLAFLALPPALVLLSSVATLPATPHSWLYGPADTIDAVAESTAAEVLPIGRRVSWEWPRREPPPWGSLPEAIGSTFQEPPPGWREGQAAAEAQGVGGRKFAGFLGGLPIAFFGIEAISQNNEPAFFGGAALAGIAVVVLAGALVGHPEPSAQVMKEVGSRGPDYVRMFREGYTTRLRERRTGAAFRGAGLGAATGAAVLFLVVAAWCSSGDC